MGEQLLVAVDLNAELVSLRFCIFLVFVFHAVVLQVAISFEFLLFFPEALFIPDVLFAVHGPLCAYLQQLFEVATGLQIRHFHYIPEYVPEYETVLFVFELVDVLVFFSAALPYLQLLAYILVLFSQ